MPNFHTAAIPEDMAGERVRLLSQQEEQQAEIAEATVALLNIAVVLDKRDEHCRMCGNRDGSHPMSCPVPHLEAWLASRP